MLKDCRECGRSIAARAKTCPHCGVKKPMATVAQANLDTVASNAAAAGCLIIILVVVLFLIIGLAACGTSNDDDDGPPSNAKELFEGCVSPWDGNHEGFEAEIRAVLNDPGGMETHGTYYSSSDSISDGGITIRLDYSAANAFGGMVRTDAVGVMDLDCEVTVITYGT